MKKKLVIISDIYGLAQAQWLELYIEILSPYFTIRVYDAKKLAEIDPALTPIEEVHHAFVTHGLARAKQSLQQLESEEIFVLGFSIGGVIAWQSALQQLSASKLYLVSSTRLRKETKKPEVEIKLFFGERDHYKPNDKWFKDLQLQPIIYSGEEHELYKKPKFCALICQLLIEKGK